MIAWILVGTYVALMAAVLWFLYLSGKQRR
jgi:hypothetical protein